ncbi:hypothetical protein K438DRAFT_1989879 [Mycena galopus ATCC 62051]|nr:hypothetical protein K438DRAFT_1989879 [Mycena galopus ATCC 62051]
MGASLPSGPSTRSKCGSISISNLIISREPCHISTAHARVLRLRQGLSSGLSFCAPPQTAAALRHRPTVLEILLYPSPRCTLSLPPVNLISSCIPRLSKSPAIHVALVMREARNCACRSCHSHSTAPSWSLPSTSRSRNRIVRSPTAPSPLGECRHASQERDGRTRASMVIQRRSMSRGQRVGKEHACRVVVSREGGSLSSAPRVGVRISRAQHTYTAVASRKEERPAGAAIGLSERSADGECECEYDYAAERSGGWRE